MKKRYRPKLDPKRDLAGATPELLVRALFRRVETLGPRTKRGTAVGNALSVNSHASEPTPSAPPTSSVR